MSEACGPSPDPDMDTGRRASLLVGNAASTPSPILFSEPTLRSAFDAPPPGHTNSVTRLNSQLVTLPYIPIRPAATDKPRPPRFNPLPPSHPPGAKTRPPLPLPTIAQKPSRPSLRSRSAFLLFSAHLLAHRLRGENLIFTAEESSLDMPI